MYAPFALASRVRVRHQCSRVSQCSAKNNTGFEGRYGWALTIVAVHRRMLQNWILAAEPDLLCGQSRFNPERGLCRATAKEPVMTRTIKHGNQNGYASLGAGGLSRDSFPMRLFDKGNASTGTPRHRLQPGRQGLAAMTTTSNG